MRYLLLGAVILLIPACGGGASQSAPYAPQEVSQVYVVNNVATFTAVNHGFQNGNRIMFDGLDQKVITAMGLSPDPNGQVWTIATVTQDTFTLAGVGSSQTFANEENYPDMATATLQ